MFHAEARASATAAVAAEPVAEVAPESVIEAVTELPPIVYVNTSYVVTTELSVPRPPYRAAICASVYASPLPPEAEVAEVANTTLEQYCLHLYTHLM